MRSLGLPTRLLAAAALATLATTALAKATLADETSPAVAELPSLEALLNAAGWPRDRLASLGAALNDENLAGNPVAVADGAKLAVRLRRFERLLAQAPLEPASNALPRRVEGRVTAAQRLPLANEAATAIGVAELFACRVERDGLPAIRLLTPRVPVAWLELPMLDQPVAAAGVRLSTDEGALPVVIAPTVQWFPTTPQGAEVRFGETVLAELGFDAGLLDTVVDGAPLLARERDAFYGLLAATRSIGANQLTRFARGNVERYSAPWNEKAKSDRLAAAVVRKANGGGYSVAPLFNDATRQRGELFVFDGVVRRALRVDAANAAERYGVDHYFELELFAEDSQNLPLVFCVAELPEGFPQGDAIAQPTRVAGFFLKRWAYRTRRAAGDGASGHDKRQLAPLLVGRAPLMLGPPTQRGPNSGLVAGVAFVLALAAVVASVWWAGRTDRKFEHLARERFAVQASPEGLASLSVKDGSEDGAEQSLDQSGDAESP